jgi:hypothetical protein
MPSSLEIVERKITRQRLSLDAWFAEAYRNNPQNRFCGELDAGFPNWHEIEALAGSVFDQRLVTKLARSSIDSLLFFISRNDEIGAILAWLNPQTGTPLSSCGDLTYPDFLYLVEQALERDEDYCDYQLAVCFQKRESLDGLAIDRLTRLFNRSDSYTRRMALHTFAHFAAPETIKLAETLWQTDQCEFARLTCLHVLKGLPDAKRLFEHFLQQYQKLYDIEAEDYRRSHMQQLTRDDQ